MPLLPRAPLPPLSLLSQVSHFIDPIHELIELTDAEQRLPYRSSALFLEIGKDRDGYFDNAALRGQVEERLVPILRVEALDRKARPGQASQEPSLWVPGGKSGGVGPLSRGVEEGVGG